MTSEELNFFKDRGSVFLSCVEHCEEAIMLTDTHGALFYVNPAWERIYGYTKEDVVGQTPRMLRSVHQNDAFNHSMWDEILATGSWKGELINRAKDGREVPIILTITPFKDSAGNIRGYMGIAVDLSEKKRMESQIIHQDRMASIGLLASGLAHEIGTPLSVVRGRAEYLQMLAGDDALKSGLNIIIEQIDRISKLIYSLLNIARAERTEAMAPIPIATALNPALTLLNQKLERNSIAVEILLPGDVTVMAEQDRLQQVLLNLIVNAIHAMEAPADQRKDTAHRLCIEARPDGDWWDIRISDTGCGISSANMKKLFQPFFTTKEVGVGTGLGLAITYQIIHSWGGSIYCESKEGTGTTFTIRLRNPGPRESHLLR